MNLFDTLLGGAGIAAGGLLTSEALGELSGIGDTAYSRSGEIGQQASDGTRFRGYGVTGPQGSVSVDPTGTTSLGLSDDMSALQDQLATGSQGLFSQATNQSPRYEDLMNQALGLGSDFMQRSEQGIAGRQDDIYEQIRAMQQPGEQRQNLALEERLAAQGRSGVSTNQYGGTPEQLALAKAQQEAQNQAAFQARGQALGEQQQQANLGSMFSGLGMQAGGQGLQERGQLMNMGQGMLQSSFMPQSSMLDMFNAGSQAFGFEDVARRQAANQLAEARMGGLDAFLGANLGRANLLGTIGSAALTGGSGLLSSSLNL